MMGGMLPLIAGAHGAAQSSVGVDGEADVAETLETLSRKASEFRTFEDFGAVGDYDSRRDTGTDDTRAIQAALDWAFGDGVDTGRAVLATAKAFLCGNITTYPCTTIVGTGRHTSSFWCKDDTTGKWWSDRGHGAQKLMLSGLAWFGRRQRGITHIAEFGNEGVQFGSEGIIQACWFRDGPEATALDVNGNVGIIRDVTLQGCKRGLRHLGNANQLENIFLMEIGEAASRPNEAIGAEIYGCFVRGMHIEATADEALPLKLYGDCHVDDLVISSANGRSFSHLIEIDTIGGHEWSLESLLLLGGNYRVRNGFIKVQGRYQGGASPREFTGSSHVRAIDIHSGRLSIRNQLWQSFALHLRNDGGTIRHRISSIGNPQASAAFAERVRGAATIPTATPHRSEPRSGFAAGGRIEGPDESCFLFDTAAQGEADQSVQSTIMHNGSGTALTVWPQILSQSVAGSVLPRLAIRFFDAVSGAPYPLTSLPRGTSISIGISGFIA